MSGHSVYTDSTPPQLDTGTLPDLPKTLLSAAAAGLDTLSRAALRELKAVTLTRPPPVLRLAVALQAMKNPNQQVQDVLAVVLTCLGQQNTDWRHARCISGRRRR